MVSVLNRWYLGRGQGQGGRRRVRGVRKGGLLGEVLGHLELRASQFCRGLASSGSGDDDKGVESNMEDFYSQMKPDSTTCVPLTAENAALPPACAKRVHLFDILPPGVVAKLQEEGIRMIGPAVPSPVRPAMGVEPEEYPAIIQKAVASGVCELTETEPESIQGLFGVRKDEDRARVILDCRPANELCYPPPNPDLPHIGVLAQLGVPEECELRGAILDLANYYHTIIMPEEWRTLFGLPAVVIDGKKMYPRWVTLPMGWSFSVYLAQLAHVYQLEEKSKAFRTCHRLRGAMVPRLIQPGVVASEPYIDDLPSLATSRRVANAGLSDMLAAEVVEAKAEKIKMARAGEAVRIWGIELDENGCFRPPPAKLRALISLTQSACNVGVVSTVGLQRLIGRWLWFVLLHRPMLSGFSPLYRQSRSLRSHVRLWPSSLQALRDLLALAPLLVLDPRRPPGQLCATDSSDRGGGVVLSEGFDSVGYWDLAPYVYYKGREDLSSETYQEGLGRYLETRRFGTQFEWHWDTAEHIGVTEARALFSGVKRVLLRSGRRIGQRHMFLVDNQGVVGAFTRGRSANTKVNSLIQRTSAACLATASTFDIIWVPTRYQPADRASRL